MASAAAQAADPGSGAGAGAGAGAGVHEGAGEGTKSNEVVIEAAPLEAGPVGASAAELFKDADLEQGEALIAESDCAACHIRNVGGDGTAIYRPAGRINSPVFLRGMVEYCNTQLNLQLFPEDVSAVAAVLNRDHYHFR